MKPQMSTTCELNGFSGRFEEFIGVRHVDEADVPFINHRSYNGCRIICNNFWPSQRT